jgi:hypothetical protein
MLQVVISIIFIFYFFLFYVVTGIWGTVVMSTQCKSLSLRTAIRGVIVTGAIGMTSLVGNSICHSQCKTTSHEELPNWLLYFLFLLCIIGMVFLVNMLGQLNKEKACQNSSLKNYTGICIGMNSIVLLVLFIGIVYRFRKKGEQKEAAKQKKLTEEKTQELRDKRTKLQRDEKAQRDKDELDSLRRQIAELEGKAAARKPIEKGDTEVLREKLKAQLEELQADQLANAKKTKTVAMPAGRIEMLENKHDDSSSTSSSIPSLEASSGASHTVNPSPAISPVHKPVAVKNEQIDQAIHNIRNLDTRMANLQSRNYFLNKKKAA